MYRMFEEWDKGISHLKKALKEDKSNILALNELVNCYEQKGEFKEVEELLSSYEAENGDLHIERILRLKYELYISQNKLDLASRIVDQRNELSKQMNSGIQYNKGAIYILKDNFIKAEKVINSINEKPDIDHSPDLTILKYLFHYKGKFKEFEKLINKEISVEVYVGDKNSLISELIYFHLGTGQIEKAIEELRNLDKSEYKDFPTFEEISLTLEILSKIASGNLNYTDLLLEKLKILVEKSIFNIPSHRRYYHLMANLKENKGEYEEAEEFYLKTLELAEKRILYHYTIVYIYNSAHFFYTRNKNNAAEKIFLEIHELTRGRFYRGDLYAKSFYYLGKIYQKKGWVGKAIESYERFYSMWKDGDQEFVGKYIEDTKKQLDLMKN